MYRRFGSRVTVIEKSDRPIARKTTTCRRRSARCWKRRGSQFRLSATCIGLRTTPTGVSASVDCTDGEPSLDGSHVLVAVGRRPNTDDLGLEAAGIDVDDRGFITVDDECRTNVPGVWALGECNGHGAFTHTAYNDYEVVAANLLDGKPRRISQRIPCYALYVDPPVGRVGMTTEEARESGRRVLVGERPMTKVSRAREMSETQGFMRALVDADTERLLGAVVFSVGGDEIVHSLLDVMYAERPYTRSRARCTSTRRSAS